MSFLVPGLALNLLVGLGMIAVGVLLTLLNQFLKKSQASQVTQLWNECDSRGHIDYVGFDSSLRPDVEKRHALSQREE